MTDLFGIPIQIGDTVVTKDFNLAQVKGFTPKKVKVALVDDECDECEGEDWITTEFPDKVIVITQQITHNHATYPELFI